MNESVVGLMDYGNSGSNRGQIADPNLQRRFFFGFEFLPNFGGSPILGCAWV